MTPPTENGRITPPSGNSNDEEGRNVAANDGSARMPDPYVHVVLVRDDDESSWWIKGEFRANAPIDALGMAWEGTYHSPRRSGTPIHRFTCAVVSPNTGWTEFTVELEAQPSTVKITTSDGVTV